MNTRITGIIKQRPELLCVQLHKLYHFHKRILRLKFLAWIRVPFCKSFIPLTFERLKKIISSKWKEAKSQQKDQKGSKSKGNDKNFSLRRNPIFRFPEDAVGSYWHRNRASKICSRVNFHEFVRVYLLQLDRPNHILLCRFTFCLIVKFTFSSRIFRLLNVSNLFPFALISG